MIKLIAYQSPHFALLTCLTVLIKLSCVRQHVRLRRTKPVLSAADVEHSLSVKTYGCSQVIKRHSLFWTDTWASDWPAQTELECYQGMMEAGEIISVFPGIHQVPNCCHYSVWVWGSCFQLFHSAWQVDAGRDMCVFVCVSERECLYTQVPVHTSTPQDSVLCLCLPRSRLLSWIVPVIPINTNTLLFLLFLCLMSKNKKKDDQIL